MSYEENRVLVELSELLVSEASQPSASPSQRFRTRLLKHIDALELQSEAAKEQKRLEKLGRIDKLDESPGDKFYKELYLATEKDSIWDRQESGYNIRRSSSRPPPSSGEALAYD